MNDLLPHIRTQRVREKMILAIQAQESKRMGARDTETYRVQQQMFRQKMRELNKRGLSQIVTRNGRTIGELMAPQMVHIVEESAVPLLPGPR